MAVKPRHSFDQGGQRLGLAGAGPAPEDRDHIPGIQHPVHGLALLRTQMGALIEGHKADAAVMATNPSIEPGDQPALKIEGCLRGNLSLDSQQPTIGRYRGLDVI
jgi:hypothetical protein